MNNTRSSTKPWLLVAGLLLAATLGAQPRPARQPIFVSVEQLDPTLLLPSPPANDSWQTLQELAELHRIEQTRTPGQVAQAQADDREESIFVFADVLGAKLTRAALPHTALLSDHVKNDEGVTVSRAKQFFKRPRPYHLDATLHPVCKVTENRNDFAYPSGHGTTGYLEALTLALMVPEKRDALLARAEAYGHSREVCGVHYAGDEVASRTIAYSMFALMMNHPQFKAELQAATTELRTALGLAPTILSAGARP